MIPFVATRVRYAETKTCILCERLYLVGDAQDQRKHRKRCAAYRAVLDAKPNEHTQPYAGRFFEVSAEISASPPRWALVHVQHCARLFSRELTMSGLASLWDPDCRGHDSALAFIPVSDDCRMQGVAVVGDPTSEKPVLTWTWIVPSMRGQGVFTRIWNMLSERFGDFFIGGPYSEGMMNYLQHRNVAAERLCYGQCLIEPGPVRFVGNRFERRLR